MKQLSSGIPTALAQALALALALLACGGHQQASAPSSGGTPIGGGPAGPAPGTGCAREIAIRCKSGVDGCEGGKTIEHVCVPQDATVGPPCAQEIALACPEGQSDGCLQTPPVSAGHICVFK